MLMLVALLVQAQERPSPDWLPILDAPPSLSHILVIPAPANFGPQLVLEGRVLKSDVRTPAAGVILYCHHTDARGIYPRPTKARPSDWSYWHGSLRGWLKTDQKGRYVLRTTKPAPYPNGGEPAHIHVYGLVPGSRKGFYFADFVFQGEPYVTDAYWRRVRSNGLGTYSGVRLVGDGQSALKGRRDLVLKG